MKSPRILPLVGVAIGGVLAVKALSSVEALPQFFQGARAMAEGASGALPNATGKGAPQPAASKPPPPVCAPTAAELAKEAGLSPAELQTLQSLGVRRGQLDEREKGLDTQLALMAAAEAKLDAKIQALNGLKGEIRGLMGQADAQKAAELDRLVTVYQQMKPKDAAARMTLLDDDVRLPIAAKMKERSLSAILGQMPPVEAKALTEKLAARFDPKLAAMRAALANPPAAAAAAPAQQAAAAKPAPGKPGQPAQTAAAKPTQVASADPIAPAAKPAAAARPAPTAARPKPRSKPRPVKRAAATPAPTAAKPAAVAANTGPRPYTSLAAPALAPAGAKPTAPAKPAALTPVGAPPAAAKAG